jgi:hypothetical protein
VDVSSGIINVLKRSATALKENGVPYCLAGGLAVSMLSRPRATEDIDIIVLVAEQELPALECLIKRTFDVFQVRDIMRFNTISIWRFVVNDATEGFVVLDLMLAERVEFFTAIQNALIVTIDGIDISVIAPEDLIEIKKLSGRPIDLMDIQTLQEEFDLS